MASEIPSVADLPSSSAIAVAPADIEREISQLWKAARPAEPKPGAESRPPVIHICLSNLIFYAPDAAWIDRVRALLPEVGRLYPSRTMLLTHDAAARPRGEGGASGLRAWVSALCHRAAPGATPVCCEEITLEAPSGAYDLFPGAVVPLLRPDVPAILILPAPGGEPIIDSLRGVVDRVLFDSRDLPLESLLRLKRVLDSGTEAEGDDLAWRDIAEWRRVVCEVFDDPRSLPFLPQLDRIEVEFEAGVGAPRPIRAALMAGWIAASIGWRPVVGQGARSFERRCQHQGRDRFIALRAVTRKGVGPGELATVLLSATPTGLQADDGSPQVRIVQLENAELLRVEQHDDSRCVIPRTAPYRREAGAQLLGRAFERNTHQGVLRRSLALAVSLIEGRTV